MTKTYKQLSKRDKKKTLRIENRQQLDRRQAPNKYGEESQKPLFVNILKLVRNLALSKII